MVSKGPNGMVTWESAQLIETSYSMFRYLGGWVFVVDVTRWGSVGLFYNVGTYPF